MYLERKIIEKVYGTARRYFDAREGWDVSARRGGLRRSGKVPGIQ